jgi:signal transduction histidine kinase
VGALDGTRIPRLLDAVTAVAQDLSLPDVLRRTVRSARELAGARYGALGVLGDDGVEELVESGDPAGPPLLIAPIRLGDRLYGAISLSSPLDGEGFTDEDEELVVALAASAAVAIENAMLFEQARRRERWLAASYEVTSALLTSQELGSTLRLIADQARLVAGGSVVAIARPTGETPVRLTFEVVEPTGPDADRLSGLTVPTEGTATGQAFVTRRPVVVRDYGAHVAEQQRAHGPLPRIVADLDSAVAVPLIAGEEALGVLLMAKFREKAPFTDAEVRLAETFAGHAALAVAFARAQADRQRLAVFEERDRIARDLHDLVIQRLFAIGLGLEGLSRLSTDPLVAERVTGFSRDLDRTIREIRNSIFSLQEPAEAQGSLRSELLRVALDASGMLGFEPRIGFDGPLDAAVPNVVRTDLVATLREALSNVARHAAAHAVAAEVTVDREGKHLILTVSDDGIGIPAAPSRRSGLANLAERAARWGGICTARAGPSGGTVLEWSADLPEAFRQPNPAGGATLA